MKRVEKNKKLYEELQETKYQKIYKKVAELVAWIQITLWIKDLLIWFYQTLDG